MTLTRDEMLYAAALLTIQQFANPKMSGLLNQAANDLGPLVTKSNTPDQNAPPPPQK